MPIEGRTACGSSEKLLFLLGVGLRVSPAEGRRVRIFVISLT